MNSFRSKLRSFASRLRVRKFGSGPKQFENPQTKRGFSAFEAFCYGTAAFTFSLGAWQVKRRAWKQGVISSRSEKLNSPPTTLPPLPNSKQAAALAELLKDYQYNPVSIKGRFDYAREVLLGVRSAPHTINERIKSANPNGGYFVITPFIVSTGGSESETTEILVNRGWIPKRDGMSKRDDVPAEDRSGQEVVVYGVVRPPETRPEYLDPEKESYDGGKLGDVWIWLNVAGISAKAQAQAGDSSNPNRNYLPLAVDMFGPPSAPFPVRRSPPDYLEFRTTPAVHTVYAATWFLLSAALVGMTTMRMRGRSRGPALTKVKIGDKVHRI